MNGYRVMWMLICLVAAAPLAVVADEGEAQPLVMEVVLADGSVLKGIAALPELCEIVAPYGRLTVRVDHIVQLIRKPESGPTILHMRNGDTVSGDLLLERFMLESLVGSLAVPLKALTSIRFSASDADMVAVPQPVTFPAD